MTKDEVLERALKALIRADRISGCPNNADEIFAIKEVLANVANNDTSEKRVDETAKQRHEPVAWRTFDGEGGYDFRDYDMNENYRDEYIKRNGIKYATWVDPLYTAPPQRQPEQEPVALPPIYFMRDNHTFKILSNDVSTALIEIEQEFNEGWTYGSLCSKRKGFAMIHASGDKTRLKFFAECKAALEAAHGIKGEV